MTEIDKTALRDAATIVLWRPGEAGPDVLMGQRGSKAAFMPDKFVFPGGAVDAQDGRLPADLPDALREQLAVDADAALGGALVHAAIRELWEETGLKLGVPGAAPDDVPQDWAGFYASGLAPDLSALTFFFRAVTPPGRPRRFDARFFLAEASRIDADLDDFSDASDELRHLQWIPLTEARNFPLPFVTEVVLAEVGEILAGAQKPDIPYFHQGVSGSSFRAIPRSNSA